MRNYYNKNILCFGDNIHKVHPLAGQGLNMALRDIKIFSELIDKKIELGLPLDQSILKDFERFEYKIMASYHESSSQEDFMQRYESLMRYLNP